MSDIHIDPTELARIIEEKSAKDVQRILQRYTELQDIITILGVEELPEADRSIVMRDRRIQRFLSQPNFVAEQYTGSGVLKVTKDRVTLLVHHAAMK